MVRKAKSRSKPVVHKFSKKSKKPAKKDEAKPKSLVGRLAAMADDAVEIRSPPKPAKGGVDWDDLADLEDEPEPSAKGTQRPSKAGHAAGGERGEEDDASDGREAMEEVDRDDEDGAEDAQGRTRGHAGGHDTQDLPDGEDSGAPQAGGRDTQTEDDEETRGGRARSDVPRVVKSMEVAARHPPADAEGVEVVAKGPGKFSLADIEALRAAIKIKGAASVVEGIHLDELKFDGEGLIPVVAQDRRTGAVLGLNWMTRDMVETSLRGKTMHYQSRTLHKPVVMDQPGRRQRLIAMRVDCDKDALLAMVDQEGPACHNDTGTCWSTEKVPHLASYLGEVDRDIAQSLRAKEGRHHALAEDPLRALKAFVDDANTVTRLVQGKAEGRLDDAAAQLLEHLGLALRLQGQSVEKAVGALYARDMAEALAKK